jgi:hypothetical protein
MAGGFVEAFTAEPQATGDAIPVPFQSMGGSSPGYILGLTMTALLALLGSASLLIRFAACLFCRKYKVQAQDGKIPILFVPILPFIDESTTN